MRSESARSESSSAGPSRTRPGRRGKSEEKREDPEVFLERQVQEASAAFRRTVREAGRDLVRVANPQPWIQQYPWISVASSSVLGFLGGCAATPARGEGLKEHLQGLGEELREKAERLKGRAGEAAGETEKAARKQKEASDKKDHGPSLWALAATSLLQLVLRAFNPAEGKNEHVVKIVGVPSSATIEEV